MSLTRDRFEIDVIGNLVVAPKLVQENSSSICKARVATNPRGHKFNPKTGETVPDEKRYKNRTFVDLVIEKHTKAQTFYHTMRKGERVWVVGEGETIQIPKLFYSETEGKYVSVDVDVDLDGQNIVTVTEDRLLVHVREFGKVELKNETPVLVYMQ